jgi:hypothetical protein
MPDGEKYRSGLNLRIIRSHGSLFPVARRYSA